ncbi:hypothetical protein M3Y98_01075400 [Aphelenchoides besseyi]|nr:hypothetical protein M3Y98_01075400 [Aphelenchoides besseyi]
MNESELKSANGMESNVELQVTTNTQEKVRTPSTPTRKRVEFADRIFQSSTSTSQPQEQPSSSTTKPAQRVKDELANEQEFFNKLEEAYRLQEKIKALTSENKKLANARDDAEQRLRQLSSGEKSSDKERHLLMTDNAELQRRLDDLTPVLAAKDAEIEKLTMEKADLVTKVRRLSTSVSQARDNTVDSRTSASAAEMARKQELSTLRERFRNLEMELQQCRQKENGMIDEIATLKRKLKEDQHLMKREQSIRESYVDENAKLTKENSDLTAKLSRCERVIERQDRELKSQTESAADRSRTEIAELQAVENRLRDELNEMNQRLNREIEAREMVEEQLRAQELSEEEVQQQRRKVQEELQALNALSESLSAENHSLREERIAIGERMSRCYKKLNDKDEQLRQLARRLEEFRRRYDDALQRIRTEVNKQNENGRELESIVHEANELAVSSRNVLGSGHQSAESTARRETFQLSYEERAVESSVSTPRASEDGRPPLSPVRSTPKAPVRRPANRSLVSTSISHYDSRSSSPGDSSSNRRKLS